MRQPKQLIVLPTGTIPEVDIAKLEKRGFIVLQCDHPESVRLLQPTVIPVGKTNAVLDAAIAAIEKDNSLGKRVQETFLKGLMALLRTPKPPEVRP